MTAFLKGRAVGQTDKLLHNGNEYSAKEIAYLIEKFKDEIPKDLTKSKKEK